MDHLSYASLAGIVVAALASGNLFFIKRLVDRIDRVEVIENLLIEFRSELLSIKERTKETSERVEDVTRLKEEVAVLKFALLTSAKPPSHTNGVQNGD